MSKKTSISIVVTTYNRPNALRLILKHLTRQTDKDFEVAIADDGSEESTLAIIKKFSNLLNIQHVWHEDDGFRASVIRNKAVACAKGNYIIFLDGDCLPLRNFVRNHRRLAEEGWLVSGNRVLLSNHYTDSIEKKEHCFDNWNLFNWIFARCRRRCNRFLPLLTFPLGFLRKLKSKSWQGVKTCNLGVWKKDFIKVNGFNENYVGWGFEDSDLVIRLFHSGIRRKNGRFALPVLHLWHPENDRQHVNENWKRLQSVKNSNTIRAVLGVDQYIKV